MSNHPWPLLLLVACCAPSGQKAAPAVDRVTATTSNAEALALFREGEALLDNMHNEEAFQKIAQAVALDPSFALARAYQGAGDPGPKGLPQLQLAASMSAGLPPPERLLIHSMLATRLGAGETARKLSRRVAELLPRDFRAQLDYGYAEIMAHNWAASVPPLRRATQINGRSGAAFGALATSLAYVGELSPAREAAQRYLLLAPREPNAHDTLAEVELVSGDLEAAERGFAKAVALAPAFAPAWDGLAFAREYRGDYAGADAALRQGIATLPREAAVSLKSMRAWLALLRGDREAALRLASEVQTAAEALGDPHQAAIAPMTYASVLIELGRHEEALQAVAVIRTRIDELRVSRGERTIGRWLGLGLKARAEHALRRQAALAGTLEQITLEAARAPTDSHLRMLRHYATGLLQELRGAPGEAAQSFASCPVDIVFCRIKLLETHQALGEPGAADRTRRELLAMRRRDAAAAYAHLRFLRGPETSVAHPL